MVSERMIFLVICSRKFDDVGDNRSRFNATNGGRVFSSVVKSEVNDLQSTISLGYNAGGLGKE